MLQYQYYTYEMRGNFMSNARLEKQEKRKLIVDFLFVFIIGAVFLAFSITSLLKDRNGEERYWTNALAQSPEMAAKVETLGANATHILSGTYVENIKQVSLKDSAFRLTAMVWFKWEGDSELNMLENFRVYKGTINDMEIVKDYHVGNENYQLARCDISVTKDFWTRRFPLESHQLRFYLESNYPVERVIFENDAESGLNTNLNIAGYEIARSETAVVAMEYANNHSDPEINEAVVTSELVTAIEIRRGGFGLYAKCFIALLGTITWVLISLFLSTYHHVDPLGMIPGALFGTVSNIMVGASLLPDALQMGLLEYVNIWGIMTILAVTFAIININRIRASKNNKEFAGIYGRMLFYTITSLVIIGNIALPLSAFMF